MNHPYVVNTILFPINIETSILQMVFNTFNVENSARLAIQDIDDAKCHTLCLLNYKQAETHV
jgi:hypothetical protein